MTVKEPSVPTVKVAVSPLVMVGACCTVSVKLCVASVPMPLPAVMREGIRSTAAAIGRSREGRRAVAVVHEVTPLGRVPVFAETVTVGKAVAVTVKMPATFSVKVAELRW